MAKKSDNNGKRNVLIIVALILLAAGALYFFPGVFGLKALTTPPTTTPDINLAAIQDTGAGLVMGLSEQKITSNSPFFSGDRVYMAHVRLTGTGQALASTTLDQKELSSTDGQAKGTNTVITTFKLNKFELNYPIVDNAIPIYNYMITSPSAFKFEVAGPCEPGSYTCGTDACYTSGDSGRGWSGLASGLTIHQTVQVDGTTVVNFDASPYFCSERMKTTRDNYLNACVAAGGTPMFAAGSKYWRAGPVNNLNVPIFGAKQLDFGKFQCLMPAKQVVNRVYQLQSPKFNYEVEVSIAPTGKAKESIILKNNVPQQSPNADMMAMIVGGVWNIDQKALPSETGASIIGMSLYTPSSLKVISHIGDLQISTMNAVCVSPTTKSAAIDDIYNQDYWQDLKMKCNAAAEPIVSAGLTSQLSSDFIGTQIINGNVVKAYTVPPVYPELMLYAKASWMGIVFPVSEPAISSVSNCEAISGRDGVVTVSVINKGQVTGSAIVGISCPTSTIFPSTNTLTSLTPGSAPKTAGFKITGMNLGAQTTTETCTIELSNGAGDIITTQPLTCGIKPQLAACSPPFSFDSVNNKCSCPRIGQSKLGYTLDTVTCEWVPEGQKCGNNVCDYDETCTGCAKDCGACPPSKTEVCQDETPIGNCSTVQTGYVCNSNKELVRQTSCESGTTSCTADTDCAEGSTCVDGTCQEGGQGTPLWIYLVGGAVALLVIGGGAIYLTSRKPSKQVKK